MSHDWQTRLKKKTQWKTWLNRQHTAMFHVSAGHDIISCGHITIESLVNEFRRAQCDEHRAKIVPSLRKNDFLTKPLKLNRP